MAISKRYADCIVLIVTSLLSAYLFEKRDEQADDAIFPQTSIAYLFAHYIYQAKISNSLLINIESKYVKT
jgi:hypothetical protein